MADAAIEVQNRLIAAAGAGQRGQLAGEPVLVDQALKINPRDPVALNARGMRALTDKDLKQAVACFSKATEVEPTEPTLWMNLASAARGQADADLERSALQRVLELDRFNFMALLRTAELEERVGRIREAALGWAAVIQLASSSVDRPAIMDDAMRHGQAYLAAQTVALSGRLDKAFGSDRDADPDLRRFNACMDHLLGRRAIYRNECHGIHYPFL